MKESPSGWTMDKPLLAISYSLSWNSQELPWISDHGQTQELQTAALMYSIVDNNLRPHKRKNKVCSDIEK